MIIQQKTKELLAESLKELAKFKSVDKITIRELTKNCGLTSPTFYNHFRDKYDLMAWIYNRRVEASMKNFGHGDSLEDVICKWMEIVLEDEDFYVNLLKNAVGQNSFRYTTNDHAINLLGDWIKIHHNLNELTPEITFCVRFYMRAISEFVSDWALDRWECSPREMAKFFVEAMPASLKPLLLQI
ncbi:MAG: TetR/AcrR family transcriptional regulator C-terminal domain-containing protein [Selenomonadaceae bacterium]|nr:TetR/AcrR family transcriptional regulator C-terminal domain-containing protein [Selenomonadaceae bacterium]